VPAVRRVLHAPRREREGRDHAADAGPGHHHRGPGHHHHRTCMLLLRRRRLLVLLVLLLVLLLLLLLLLLSRSIERCWISLCEFAWRRYQRSALTPLGVS